jgi:hypothetical protein
VNQKKKKKGLPYLFGDKYLFSILPNQQRVRSDFCLIFYMVKYGHVGKCIMRKSNRYAASLIELDLVGSGGRTPLPTSRALSVWQKELNVT